MSCGVWNGFLWLQQNLLLQSVEGVILLIDKSYVSLSGVCCDTSLWHTTWCSFSQLRTWSSHSVDCAAWSSWWHVVKLKSSTEIWRSFMIVLLYIETCNGKVNSIKVPDIIINLCINKFWNLCILSRFCTSNICMYELESVWYHDVIQIMVHKHTMISRQFWVM